ncbi:MAG: ribbon-helix-helix domain-containing protein [Oscillospiraceae bacterium]|nr:ribbon-helix-helix domain-containing protein [Oscillospiraceae bacterium]
MSSFIPKQYKKDPVTIRMTEEKTKRVDKAAAAHNLSRSEFINQCIDYALENMPKPKNSNN